MKLSPGQILAIGAVGIGGVIVYFTAREARQFVTETVPEAAAAVGQAVNPVNNRNIFYRGFNATLRGIGAIDEGSTLGSSIYDFFHASPPLVAPSEPFRGPLQ